jgi:1,4-alpha-glucan branching enzyme
MINKAWYIPSILFFINITFAQIVVTEPEYPTQNDSIVVIFDATQTGAEELLNYTGTLYAHTGVNTNLGDWQHVIGSWGNNSNQPSLIRLDNNLYKLTIGKPREFYNVTNSFEKILQLAIVFRSSDGNSQTRPDIFIDLYEPGLNVVIDNPQVSNVDYGDPLRSPVFVRQFNSVDIKVSAVTIETEVSSLTLFVDQNQVSQSFVDTLEYTFNHGDYTTGAHTITAIGVDTAGLADSTSFVMFVNPVIEDMQPPEGVQPGITINSPTSVTLMLFAPYKKFVYLLGDFNDWKVDSSYFLKRWITGQDKITWWITLNNITPGTEYGFQYLVDGDIRIADPYTEKILDPWNDQYISPATYPNLKPYPTGKTGEAVSVFQTDQIPYNWNVTNFQRPAETNLVIYELLVRDFVSTHDYKTLTDTIGYLKRLGINAVELMPVMEFEGNESWGYNPSFHFALDKYYGPKNDFKTFVDSCHANGIAVILDIVLNHIYGQSPLVRLYWDDANGRPAANNPWLNVTSPNPAYSWGYDFNHESQATKDYVDRVTRYWLSEYNIDGYRFDFTKGFTNTPGDGSGFDQSRIDILERMVDSLWAFDSTAYVVLEHFAPNSEETILANYGMMLWGNMNSQYNEATMGYASNLSDASYKTKGWAFPHLVAYMESHDEERLMYKNLRWGNSSGDYIIKDNLNLSLQRMKLAAAFYFLIPGPKMIWQFGELGYDYSIFYDPHTGTVPEPYGTDYAKTDSKPIRWDYFNVTTRLNLYKIFSALIHLKENYDVFRSTDFTTIVATYSKRINVTDPSMNVTIIGNFYVQENNIDPEFQQTGWWYDYFTGDSIYVTNTSEQISLQAGEFHIYTSVKLPAPEQGIIDDVESDISEQTVYDFSLAQNYPNPFNPSTKIKYTIPSAGTSLMKFVQIKIYDILGDEVAVLVNKEQPSGSYEVEFNASKLSSGIYFYQLTAGDFHKTKKMILLR